MSRLHSRHFHVDERPEALTVGDRRRVAPALAGALFLAAGLGIWGFIGVLIVSHARAGSLGAPGGYLPMVGLLLAGGAPFVWVGARLCLHNHSVRIRRLEATVEEIQGYVLFRRVRVRRLAEFKAVQLRRNVRSRSGTDEAAPSGASHTSLSVELMPTDAAATPLRLAFDYDEGAIRALGALVARGTGLPVSDALRDSHLE